MQLPMNSMDNIDLSHLCIERRSDQYINATKLCASKKKDFNDFAKQKRTKAVIARFVKSLNMKEDQLIQYGDNIWIHPQLSFFLLYWLDCSYAMLTGGLMCEINDKLFEKVNTKSIISTDLSIISCLVQENNDLRKRLHDAEEYVVSLCAIGKNENMKSSETLQQNKTKTKEQPKSSDRQAKNIIMRSLKLNSGETVQIEQREDAYVNATKLCKAAGKEFGKWNENKSSREYINFLSGSTRIRKDVLIQEIMTGPNHLRGTWVHPKIAIYIAFWCSPAFADQVTSWVFELLTTGSVILGKERSDDEIMKKELENIKAELERERQKQKAEKAKYESEINDLNDKKVKLETQNNTITTELTSLTRKHTILLKKRKHPQLKQTNCFYIVRDPYWPLKRYKFGISDDINCRLKAYRTFSPETVIKFLLYLNDNKILEDAVKENFINKLLCKNHEIVCDVELDELIKFSSTVCFWKNLPFEMERIEVLNEYNGGL